MEQEAIKQTLTNGNTPMPTEKFEQWCLVELFGHSQIAGLVTEAIIGGCSFLRVDVPNRDGEGVMYTRYFGNGAIYAINVTTKEDAVKIVNRLHPAPPTPRTIEQRSLPTGYESEGYAEREQAYSDEDDD